MGLVQIKVEYGQAHDMATAFGVRLLGILLANSENGTVQGAVATWRPRKSPPTRRQVATAPCTVPIRQRYLERLHSKDSADLCTGLG